MMFKHELSLVGGSTGSWFFVKTRMIVFFLIILVTRIIFAPPLIPIGSPLFPPISPGIYSPFSAG